MSTWFAPAGATVKDNSQDQIAQAGNTKVKRYTDLLNSGKELTTDDYNTIFSDSDIVSAKDSNKLYGRAISEFLGKDPIFTDVRKAFQNNFRNSQGDLMSFELVQRRINEAGLKGKLTPEAMQRVNTVVGNMYQNSLRAHTEDELQKTQQNLFNIQNKLKNSGMRQYSEEEWLKGGIFPGGIIPEKTDKAVRLANQVFTDIPEVRENSTTAINALNTLFPYSGLSDAKINEYLEGDPKDLAELTRLLRQGFNEDIKSYFKNFGKMAKISEEYRIKNNTVKVSSMSQQSK